MGKTCKEYQEDLKINAENDENSKKNIEALNVKSHIPFNLIQNYNI